MVKICLFLWFFRLAIIHKFNVEVGAVNKFGVLISEVEQIRVRNCSSRDVLVGNNFGVEIRGFITTSGVNNKAQTSPFPIRPHPLNKTRKLS